MTNNSRLTFALCFLWIFFSLPLSVILADTEFDVHIFMEIFSLFLVLYPMWISLGWRWVTRSTLPKEVMILLGILTLFLIFKISREIIYLPILCYIVLIVFDFATNGESKKLIHSAISKIKDWVSKPFNKKIILGLFITSVCIGVLNLVIRNLPSSFRNTPSSLETSSSVDSISENLQAPSKITTIGTALYSIEEQKNSIEVIDISEHYSEMTSLQKELYIKTLTHSLVSGYGSVKQVSLSKDPNISEVFIEMRPSQSYNDNRRFEIHFEMSTSEAMKINQNESFPFYGKIERLSSYHRGHLKLYLYDVVLIKF